MKRRSFNFSLLFILVINLMLLTSCNLPTRDLEDRIAIGVAQTNVVQTQTAANKNNAALPSNVEPDSPAPPQPEQPPQSPLEPSMTHTTNWTPTLTLTSTITPTITLSIPMVSVSQNTNCRKGPGQAYKTLGALLVGEQAEDVGRSADNQNWIIKNPDGAGECWLWGYYATITGITANLPVITPPSLFDWSSNWTVFLGDNNFAFIDTMIVTINGKNFSAVIDEGGGDMTNLKGTVSDDFLTVSGTWTNTIGGNGSFAFFALGDTQFQGHDDQGVGWCGDRSGVVMPDPCYK